MTLKEAEELARKVDNIIKWMVWVAFWIGFPVYILAIIYHLITFIYK